MDSSTFQLRREEIQRRIQERRIAIDYSREHQSSWPEILLSGGSAVFDVAKKLEQSGAVRSVAGAAVSFIVSRLARKVFK
jgi:hypothetical protein